MAWGMLENPPTMSFAPSASATIFRNILLVVCVVMPWLNPFAVGPSTAVMPLLLSWMCVACLGLLVFELPLVPQPTTRLALYGLGLFMGMLTALLTVPQVVDHALTAGLITALLSVGLMTRVGLHVAWCGSGLVRWVAWAWVLAAVFSSVLAVLQYLGLAQALSPWVNQPLPGDAFANLRQRNQFASLTSLGLVAGLAVWAHRARRGAVTPRTLACAWLVLNVLAIGVACSASRTGAVQWVVIGGLAALWAWRNSYPSKSLGGLALMAPVLVVLWSVLMPWLAAQLHIQTGVSVISRLAGHAQDYGVCGQRQVLWSNMWVLLVQRPWLGWGWGETDFAHFMTAYPGLRFCDMLDNAHNLPLHLAVELGLPLAIALVGGAVVWALQRQPWRERDPWRSMAWGVLTVLTLHSLVEYPLWYGPFQMTLGLALGLLWSRPNAQRPDAVGPIAQRPSSVSQAWAITLACLLFLGCLYAAWDFNRVAQIYRAPAQRDAMYRDDPLAHAKASWLFRNQAEFAELTVQTVTTDNAQHVFTLASRLMHYSPEPRVVERLIDSAKLLGHDELAQTLSERLKDAQHHVQH